MRELESAQTGRTRTAAALVQETKTFTTATCGGWIPKKFRIYQQQKSLCSEL